jgi:hypothetical protein
MVRAADPNGAAGPADWANADAPLRAKQNRGIRNVVFMGPAIRNTG